MDVEKIKYARKMKNDEFYTQRCTIEEELVYWPNLFQNKTVYCNCDTDESEFVKFFKDNFNRLGLSRLIYSSYNPNGAGQYSIVESAHTQTHTLEGNGDFRSDECIRLVDMSDIVVTNPPFSLLREFIWLMYNHKKDYLVIGSLMTAVTQNLKPLIGTYIRLGYTHHSGHIVFKVPSDFQIYGHSKDTDSVHVKNGETYVDVVSTRWITNLPTNLPKKNLTKVYNPMDYPKYIDYDYINVNRICDIPIDYYEPIGVPITFMDWYDESEWDILDLIKPKILKNGVPIRTFQRLIVKRKKRIEA